MSGFDWSAIREGGPDCPSEPELERLHLRAGPPADLGRIEAHASGCDDCQAYLGRLSMGFDVVPDLDERALLAGVRRRLDETPARRPWWQWLVALVPVGAVAAAVFLMVRPPDPGAADAGVGTRMKGFGFTVHRQTAAGSAQVASGDRFAPGDRLQIEVSLPEAGQLAVFGREPSGKIYRAWPIDKETAKFAAGRHTLPDALELDDTLGRESLAVVLCPTSIPAAPYCLDREGDIEGPPDCYWAKFDLQKQR